MAWFGWTDVATAVANGQKIVDSERSYEESIFWGGAEWTRTVAIEEYRYIGLTEAGADAALAAINNPPSVTATKERENNAGAYTIKVSEITYGTWSV